MDSDMRRGVIEALVEAANYAENSASDGSVRESVLLRVACLILCRDDVQALDPKIPSIVDELVGIHFAIDNIS